MVLKHRIVVIGDGGVGKSCLTIQFCQNNFIPDYDPTIENMYKKNVSISGDPCILEILDTAGQEEYTSMRDQHILAGHGFIIVYAINNQKSFEKIDEYVESILNVKDVDEYPMIIVGNKCDLESERAVSTQDGIEISKHFGCPFFETSAKTRTNVDESFFCVVKEIRKYEAKRKSMNENKKRYNNNDGDGCCVIV